MRQGGPLGLLKTPYQKVAQNKNKEISLKSDNFLFLFFQKEKNVLTLVLCSAFSKEKLYFLSKIWYNKFTRCLALPLLILSKYMCLQRGKGTLCFFAFFFAFSKLSCLF
jgi:hypothetical protein